MIKHKWTNKNEDDDEAYDHSMIVIHDGWLFVRCNDIAAKIKLVSAPKKGKLDKTQPACADTPDSMQEHAKDFGCSVERSTFQQIKDAEVRAFFLKEKHENY